MTKGLIIAPGLDDYLAKICIKNVAPDIVAFLVDEATDDSLSKIIKETSITNYKRFFIKRSISTTETIEEFLKAFHWISKEKNCNQVFIDASNTLKPRAIGLYSTGAFLKLFSASIQEKTEIKLCYVMCEFESKNGKGYPIEGTEKLIELDEPMESLGFVLTMNSFNAFNNHHYSESTQIFDILKKNSSHQNFFLYDALFDLSKGFDAWDKFDLKNAQNYLNSFKIKATKIKQFEFLHKLEIDQKIFAIQKAMQESINIDLMADLFENASRRLEESRFDDALARYYRVSEMVSQFYFQKFGVDASAPDYSKFPKNVIEKFGRTPEKLALKDSLELLGILDKDFEPVVANIKGAMGLMKLRNSSILAHGNNAIGKEHAQSFKEKLAKPLLETLCKKEGIELEKLLLEHSHLKLPTNIKEIYNFSKH